MGDADGKLVDRVGHPVQRNSSAGLIFGSRGRTNGEDDRRGRAG